MRQKLFRALAPEGSFFKLTHYQGFKNGKGKTMSEPEKSFSASSILSASMHRGLSASGPNSFRAAASFDSTGDRLGPLDDLAGFWQGIGFGLIARPNFADTTGSGIFLELNILQETLELRPIGSPVMNRGSEQGDIAIYGLTYLHRVTDLVTGSALHIEPGLWLNIPATTEPASDASIARLATIPHGNSVCTVGHSENVVFEGQPEIPPANTVPFAIGSQPPPPGTPNPFAEYDLSKPSPNRTSPLPAEITQDLINDPNVMLRNALKPQNLKKIVRLITNTPSAGSIGNIPFITTNADTPSLESVFAIETVQNPAGDEFLQLQYSQTALLNFRGLSFPHVTVGTLIKAF